MENLTSDSTERCPSHKAQQLELYCEDHDEVVCILCVAINHRSCEALRSISDEKIGSLFKHSTSDQIIEQLSNDKLDLEATKNATMDVLSEFMEQKELAVNSVRDHKAELVTEHA
ncbi:uncharacterized protein LOC132753546 [Ruditapes philippinarum]|uniref:uncharacterized protein LOC132753546 n=1 Tax=Ruditapes philippinarum TaxID=129788 RepID=UPI00295C35F2|nr:uncharacterized protein LOC132753546 [Ruditapes philippinarum]